MPSKKLVLKTYLIPEEFDEIQASASKAGLSLSTFSKRVCLGYTVPSLEHQEARLGLRRLKGDLAAQASAGQRGGAAEHAAKEWAVLELGKAVSGRPVLSAQEVGRQVRLEANQIIRHEPRNRAPEMGQ